MPLAALPFPNIDPVLIEIGPFAIRWYALAYIAGLVLGWLYAARLAAHKPYWGARAPISRADLDDFLLWAVIGIIVGGRVGYVLFYNFAYYLTAPLEALAIWHGGMSFHGGLAGMALAVWWFSHRRGLPVLSLGDLVSAAAPIGLFFGRVANFINGELFGRASDVPWAVAFPAGGPQPRHPSQLYEALLEGAVLFLALNWLIRRGALQRPGLVFGALLIGYGLARVFVEFFRLPDPQIGFLWGGLTMGMTLSAPMIAIGVGLVLYARRAPAPEAAPKAAPKAK
jgi:phosphatidylglycerol:prolipoprotein diacylglycerol transferase